MSRATFATHLTWYVRTQNMCRHTFVLQVNENSIHSVGTSKRQLESVGRTPPLFSTFLFYCHGHIKINLCRYCIYYYIRMFALEFKEASKC